MIKTWKDAQVNDTVIYRSPSGSTCREGKVVSKSNVSIKIRWIVNSTIILDAFSYRLGGLISEKCLFVDNEKDLLLARLKC